MTDYLEAAAAELRNARNSNENRVRLADAMHSGQAEAKQALLAEVNDRRMEIAAAFTRLAECQAAMLNAARMPDFPAAEPKGHAPEDPS